MPPPARPLFVALEWIPAHCVVPDGWRRGAIFTPYDYQFTYLANFYKVRGEAEWVPANPLKATAFTYRRGLLVGPQKVGKNPLVAAQVCLEFVGPALFGGWAGRDEGYACADHGCGCGWEYAYEPGEPKGMGWASPKIQITAFSEESTENTYDALRPMIELGPLSDLLKTNEEFIRHPNGVKDSRIDTVTASALSRLGQRVTFVPQDEVGVYTAENKMVRVADTQYRGLAGMGGRATLTTNPWDPSENSVAQQQFESAATDIYRQYTQPPRALSFTDRRDRRKIFQIVYPDDTRREHGGHVELDSIEAEAADLMERDLPQAQRFFGNILVAGAGHAVDPDAWDALARPERPLPEPGSRVGAGFDGSITQDATVIRACTPDGFSFIWQKWVRPATRAEMNAWLADHPGKAAWEVDRLEVDESINRLFETYSVGLMLCDTPRWRTEIAHWAERHGEEIVLASDTNSAKRFAPMVDRWLTGLANGSHTHDGDPLTDAHVKATHRRKVRLKDEPEDGRTMYVLVKGADRQRIDACITDVLAYEAAMTMPEEERSVYESRGFLILGRKRKDEPEPSGEENDEPTP